MEAHRSVSIIELSITAETVEGQRSALTEKKKDTVKSVKAVVYVSIIE